MLLEVLQDISKNNKDIHKESAINRAIAVEESYSIVYGLTRESDPRPLSLIATNDIENLDELSSWDLRIDQYVRLRIAENFQLSVLEFMDLPRRMITKLIKTAETIERAAMAEQKIAEEKAERAWKEQQGNVPLSTGFQHQIPKIK